MTPHGKIGKYGHLNRVCKTVISGFGSNKAPNAILGVGKRLGFNKAPNAILWVGKCLGPGLEKTDDAPFCLQHC